jgi:hypothetical protein
VIAGDVCSERKRESTGGGDDSKRVLETKVSEGLLFNMLRFFVVLKNC